VSATTTRSRTRRARLPLLFLLLAPLQALAAPVHAAPAAARARAGDTAGQLRRATEHFRAGRYAEARELFDLVLASKAQLPQRVTIAFNAAVSSYALEDYADAARRFDALALEPSELAAQARVNAGFCALRLGDLDAAALRAEPSASGDPVAEARREELRAELERARQARAQQELGECLDGGFAAIAQKDWSQAREQLRRALSLAGDDPDVLADASYGLGLVELEQGRPQLAEQHFRDSLRHRPGDGRTALALARATEDTSDRPGAAAAYESALALPLEQDEKEDAERSLLRLYPLPATGVSALLALGVGADGNAAQSGSGDVLGSVAQTQASAYVSGLVDLGLMWRTSRRSAVGLNYSGDVLALLNPNVEELSLQAHELVARGQWAPVPGLRLRLDAGAAYVLSGLDPIQFFEWDAVFGFVADLDTSSDSRARLQLGERVVSAAELDYLDGHRLHAVASEFWYLGPWELSVQALLRYTAAGVQQIELGPDTFDACSPNCDRGRLSDPASYWSPGLGLGAAWQATSLWRFSGSTRAEYRGYLDAAAIAGVRDSHKTRQDWRWRAQLGAELVLDKEARFRLTLVQSLLVKRSNVAFDASDPLHQYDYGDRNFVQPTTELGISASLP